MSDSGWSAGAYGHNRGLLCTTMTDQMEDILTVKDLGSNMQALMCNQCQGSALLTLLFVVFELFKKEKEGGNCQFLSIHCRLP